MNANTMASLLAVACTAGTAFFGAMGITAKHDYFLLLGNVACTFGNGLFIFALGEGHPTFQTYFVLMTLFSVYATYRVYGKYQRYGCDDDEDVEDDDEDEAAEEEQERRQVIADSAAGVDSSEK